MSTPTILVFAGSTRTGSLNKSLARAAAQRIDAAGGAATFVDLRDYPMPLYDGDLEAESGYPEHAESFYQLMLKHDGLLIACPEYNSSITAVLKNAIDWASRPREGDAPLAAFQGKVAALVAASPGGFGGLRGLNPVRTILHNIGVLVLPNQLAVPAAHDAFDADGALTNEKVAGQLGAICDALVKTTRGVLDASS